MLFSDHGVMNDGCRASDELRLSPNVCKSMPIDSIDRSGSADLINDNRPNNPNRSAGEVRICCAGVCAMAPVGATPIVLLDPATPCRPSARATPLSVNGEEAPRLLAALRTLESGERADEGDEDRWRPLSWFGPAPALPPKTEPGGAHVCCCTPRPGAGGPAPSFVA